MEFSAGGGSGGTVGYSPRPPGTTGTVTNGTFDLSENTVASPNGNYIPVWGVDFTGFNVTSFHKVLGNYGEQGGGTHPDGSCGFIRFYEDLA